MNLMSGQFLVPATLDEALEMMSDGRRPAIALGGGTHVMAWLSRDSMRTSRLVDLSRLGSFPHIRQAGEDLVLEPAVTYSTVMAASTPAAPRLLRKIARGITGGPQILNQGTLGGSACYANPGSDMPTGLVALKARMKLASRARGERIVAASDFFEAAFRTALRDDELLVEVLVPCDVPGERWGYVKLKTAESSWPVAVAAARIHRGANSSPLVSISLGAAIDKPLTLPAFPLASDSALSAEERLRIRDTIRALHVTWWSDELTDALYRRRVAEVVALRAVEDAMNEESNE